MADDDDEDDGQPGAAAAGLRIDRWLWCVRLYKTRSLAAAAVNGGRVHLNGARAKPSRAVQPGDVLTLALGGRDIELSVAALPTRRGPAPEAHACYQESAASVARGTVWQAQQRLAALAVPRPAVRPDKKERRQLIDLARRQGRE